LLDWLRTGRLVLEGVSRETVLAEAAFYAMDVSETPVAEERAGRGGPLEGLRQYALLKAAGGDHSTTPTFGQYGWALMLPCGEIEVGRKKCTGEVQQELHRMLQDGWALESIACQDQLTWVLSRPVAN
jgi:hypothetical protein